MFSVGFSLPSLEIHLLSYGVQEKNIGMWFNVNTIAYISSSLICTFIQDKVYKPLLMTLGLVLLSMAYFLIGPSPLLFSENFVFVFMGLGFAGFSLGFIYCNDYAAPSLPHMIELAHHEYGYQEDGRLNDTLSEITNINQCIGEIVGPLFGAFLPYFIGYRMATTTLSCVFLTYALVYANLTRVFQKKIKEKNNSGKEMLIEME